MGTHPIFESDFDCLTETVCFAVCHICWSGKGPSFFGTSLAIRPQSCQKVAPKKSPNCAISAPSKNKIAQIWKVLCDVENKFTEDWLLLPFLPFSDLESAFGTLRTLFGHKQKKKS